MTELTIQPGELDGKLRQCQRCREAFVFDFWCTSYCQNCESISQGRTPYIDLTREAIEHELYRERTRRQRIRG